MTPHFWVKIGDPLFGETTKLIIGVFRFSGLRVAATAANSHFDVPQGVLRSEWWSGMCANTGNTV